MSDDTQWTVEDLVGNMAQSSVVEYEIGLLVSQALDMVGKLVALSKQRVGMHSAIAETDPQSLEMETVHRALHQALFDVFKARPHLDHPTPALQNESPPCEQTTLTRLTTHQFQELGAAFGRDPSSLKQAVRGMWDSTSSCPDFSGVVTRPSPLLTIY